jgi:peptidoglycan/xylan/chitin deacetylase (PgdA/CDA1 family)
VRLASPIDGDRGRSLSLGCGESRDVAEDSPRVPLWWRNDSRIRYPSVHLPGPGSTAPGARRPMAWFRSAVVLVARTATRGRARIFMFHRFGPPGTPNPRRLAADILDRQLSHLRRHYRIVPLRELVARLRAGRDLSPGTVALTVDDAYSDFGEDAYPVFAHHQVPVTLYVVSDFASGRIWLWWDAIRYMLTAAVHGERAGSVLGNALRLSFSGPDTREQAWRTLAGRATALSPQERDRYLGDLQQLMGVVLPSTPPPEYAAMTWDHLRRLDPSLVEIGAHTRTHPILSHCDAEQLRAEVEESRQVIEHELGRPITTFCYPNGQPPDVNEAVRTAVRNSGYESAVMACGSLVGAGSDPTALSRLGASANWDAFVSEASGLPFLRDRMRSWRRRMRRHGSAGS